MKLDGWAERCVVGLMGLVLGAVIMGVLVLTLDLWYWPMLLIPPVCMVLAMILGESVIKGLMSSIWENL